MRKSFFMLLSTALLAFPLLAQEKPQAGAPKPIEDPFWESLIGKWEGWSESPEGKSQDEVEFEWELHKQFLKTKVTSKMNEKEYKSTGYATLDPATGARLGYWFDTYRGFSKSTETRDGNKIMMKSEGPVTIERVAEKVGEDKMVGTFRVTAPDGSVVEGKWELMRKKKDGKK
jgi:hypothetical protein